jgi:thioester reductase-like protein
VAFAANPAFDAATMELWAPLLNGGRIVIIDQDILLEPLRFGQALKRHLVNILWLTVGLFNQYARILSKEIATLRYLIVGGDVLDPRVIARVLQGNPPQHLLNGYGPTEATTFATTHEISGVFNSGRSIPIGRPIANTRIYILDGYMQPVPVGVTGELYIGGAGVARGYLNRPELTAERFLKDPFVVEADARMYRTGDLGRWLPDGNIEFLGRNDFQVKVRGFRIELGEIEARLAECRGVRQAVVVAREDDPGDKRLVAYYICDDGIAPDMSAGELRAHLSTKLPEYMLPAAYVRLESLPLTPNGKLNRNALPVPDVDGSAAPGYEAPQGEIETALAAIWAHLLNREHIGRHDNFFDLGGHSLMALQMISDINQVLGIDPDIRSLFKAPVIADLAAILIQEPKPSSKQIVRDLAADVSLDSTIRVSHKLVWKPAPQNILLTGASGFLGAFLLSNILKKTHAIVHCLIRCSIPEAGRTKLATNLKQYGLWNEHFMSRIVAIPGDLSKPLFGLTLRQFQTLSQLVDVIYHNGAQVNALHTYDTLKSTNVLGTQEILRLASSQQLTPVHFISTIEVLSCTPSIGQCDTLDNDIQTPETLRKPSSGYAQSKWVAEHLIKAARSLGIPVTVYRPSFISGSTRTGAGNTTDLLSRLIDACIDLGSVPDANLWLNMLPVDYVSDVILFLSCRQDMLGRTFTMANPSTTNLRGLWDCLLSIKTATPMVRLPYKEWWARCKAAPSTAPITALLPYTLDEFPAPIALLPPNSDLTPTAIAVASEEEILCPQITSQLLETYISWRQITRKSTSVSCAQRI